MLPPRRSSNSASRWWAARTLPILAPGPWHRGLPASASWSLRSCNRWREDARVGSLEHRGTSVNRHPDVSSRATRTMAGKKFTYNRATSCEWPSAIVIGDAFQPDISDQLPYRYAVLLLKHASFSFCMLASGSVGCLTRLQTCLPATESPQWRTVSHLEITWRDNSNPDRFARRRATSRI